MNVRSAAPAGSPPAATTRAALLACGIVAGPLYVAVSLAQALARDGFDLTRHSWSLLANGDWGWVQVVNLMLTGGLTVAAAAGVRLALRPGRGARWAPRLIGAYGVGLVLAGVFRADPAGGFPAGTTDTMTWQGALHLLFGGIGFVCLFAASLALASRFAVAGQAGWATFSRVAGSLLLLTFVALAATGGQSAAVLAFTAAVVLIWGWLSAVSAYLRASTPGAREPRVGEPRAREPRARV